MDYSKVFGLPESVEAWIIALGLPSEVFNKLEASGYTSLLACAYLEEEDIREMEIALSGYRRTLLAGSAQLRSTLDRVKAKVVETEALSTNHETSGPLIQRNRTPICNSAIPRGVAHDYWDRARARDRFQDRVRNGDGIHLMLVRHAQSVANVDMKYYTTHSDYSIPLSEQGIRQAAESGRQIAAYYCRKFDLPPGTRAPPDWLCRIWTSPYVRTRQTSKLLMENSDGWITDIQENVLLVEQNFGLFEGVDWYSGELDDKYPDELHHYQKAAAFGGRFWAKIPLGESRFDVCMRVSQCFGTIHRDVSRCNIRNFVIVSHGTSLRAFMMMWLRLLPEWFEEEPNPTNASIRIIDDYQDEGYIWPRKSSSSDRERIISNSLMLTPSSSEATLQASASSSRPHAQSAECSTDNHTVQRPTGFGPAIGDLKFVSEFATDGSPPPPPPPPPALNIWDSFDRIDIEPAGYSPLTSQQRIPHSSPHQYGGSEDILLRSSASAHPVNEHSTR